MSSLFGVAEERMTTLLHRPMAIVTLLSPWYLQSEGNARDSLRDKLAYVRTYVETIRAEKKSNIRRINARCETMLQKRYHLLSGTYTRGANRCIRVSNVQVRRFFDDKCEAADGRPSGVRAMPGEFNRVCT